MLDTCFSVMQPKWRLNIAERNFWGQFASAVSKEEGCDEVRRTTGRTCCPGSAG